MKKSLIIWLLLVLYSLLPSVTTPRVLILQSYHAEYTVSENWEQGIVSGFASAQNSPEIFFEYIDSLRNPDGNFTRYLSDKYPPDFFTLVITVGWPARNWWVQNRTKISHNIPAIMCSDEINPPQNTVLVSTRTALEQTLNLVNSLQPPLNNVYILNDNTPAGQQWQKSIDVLRKSSAVKITCLPLLSAKNLHETISTLPGNSAVIIVHYLVDGDGVVLSKREWQKIFTTRTGPPIYSLYDYMLNTGITGGGVLSAKKEAEAAAHAALDYLAGSPTLYVELKVSPFLLDYRQSERHQLNTAMLASGVVLVNKPPDFIQRYKKQINWFIILFILAVSAFVVLFIHTLEKRRSYRARDKNRRYLSTIINNLPSILFSVDTLGIVKMCNAAFIRFSGKNVEEIIGRNLLSLFPEQSSLATDILVLVRNRDTCNGIKKAVTNNGIDYHVSLQVLPLPEEQEQSLVIVEDQTQAHALSEISLEADKMRSIGGLAGGIAHEINNPLGGILQASDTIRRRVSADLPKNLKTAEDLGLDITRLEAYLEERGIYKALDQIQDSGKRAAAIINSMMSFARRKEFNYTPQPIEVIIQKAVDLARSDYDLAKICQMGHVSFNLHIPEGLPDVPCEPGEIEQVFYNIIRNAVQAMYWTKTAMPRLDISAKTELETIRLEIADNGPGMTEEVRRRIFEPFFSTREVGRGSGIGLAVSYFIITNNHRGLIKVESQPGRGSSFIIQLPLI